MRRRNPSPPIVQPTLRLFRQLGPEKRQFVPGLFMSASVRLLFTLLLASFYGNATAAILDGSIRHLPVLALYYSLPLAAIAGISALSHSMVRNSIIRATAQLRSRVVRHLLHAPLEAGLSGLSGTQAALVIQDVPTAMDCLRRAASRPLEGLLRGVGSFAYVAWVDWRVALIALAISSLGLAYSLPFARALRRSGDQVQEAIAMATVRLKDLLNGVIAVRVYGKSRQMQDRFEEQVEAARHEGIRRARISAVLAMFNNGYSGLSQAALILVLGLLAVNGQYDVPTFVRLLQVAPGIYHMFSFSRWLAELMGSLAGAQRVFDALDKEMEPLNDDPAPDPEPDAPVVSMNDVWFGHNPDRPVLRGVSFTVQHGETVAIVGESGNGKSTILRLLQGMYRPDSGEIRMQGVPLTQWPLRALRKQMALVPQEPGLVSGSIGENISLGNQFASRAEWMEAIRTAGARSFISRLPSGLDTPVRERGNRLSGGQRQRIAIARALVKDAPVLLLDEATSSLDTQTELAVRDALRHIQRQRTIIVVAHRLATIRDADRIVVLQQGRVAEQGTHDELLQINGEYARLYRTQSETQSG